MKLTFDLEMIKRVIPSSGEELPVVGLGTYQTFDLSDSKHYPTLENVLAILHQAGGRLMDSSPMYGRSEKVIGDITSEMEVRNDFFYATKIWTTGLLTGVKQMKSSMAKMKRQTIDLIQIHNLTDWETHLPQLQQWKEEGKIRYTGITHYTDASHEELIKIISTEKVDFVQFNYSMLSRHAEKSLLQTAADHGVATMINRPFGTGSLFRMVAHKPLPEWAGDFDIDNWSTYFLKYIISHPAVTCVIPASRNPQHETDNVKGGAGVLPDESTRKKMVDYLSSL